MSGLLEGFFGLGGLAGLSLLVVGVLVWRASDSGRPVSGLAIAAGVMLAPLIVGASLVDAAANNRFGDVRLSLNRLSLDLTRSDFTAGGDLTDDIYVRGSIPGLVRLDVQAAAAEGADIVVNVRNPVAGDAISVVARGAGDRAEFLGAQPFAPGRVVCIEACEAGEAVWYRFASQPLRFESLIGAEPGPKLPRRKAFDVVDTVHWKPSQAVYPLSRLLPGAVRTDSLVYHTGQLFGGGWRILLLDPQARTGTVGESGQVIVDPPVDASSIRFSEVQTLSIWDVRLFDPALDADANASASNTPMGRLQERREITLSRDRSQVTVRLATPSVERVGRCTDSGLVTPAFSILGDSVNLRLAQYGSLASSEDCLTLGSAALAVPDLKGGALHLRLDRLTAPWLLLVLATGWAVVIGLIWNAHWRQNRLHWMLYVLLQTLLAFRLLISVAGIHADPALPQGLPVIGEAAMAYVAVPALLLLLSPPAERRQSRMLLILMWLAVSFAVIRMWNASPGGLSLVATGVATLMAIGWVVVDRLRLAGREVPDWSAVLKPIRRASGWLVILPVTALWRGLLGLMSFKERLPVVKFAVSALYTPALILGFSSLMAAGVRAEGRKAAVLGFAFAAAVVGLFFVLPIGVNDNGYAIVAFPVLIMAAWGVWVHRKRRASMTPLQSGFVIVSWAGLMPMLLVAALVGMVLIRGADVPTPADIQEASVAVDDGPALDILDQVSSHDQNTLRLWMFGTPGQVERLGSWEAENLAVWSRHLADYVRTPFGRGYLHDPNLSALKPVHLNDNVSAVHIMAPYGRFTVAALLFLIAVVAAASARVTRLPGDPLPDRARLAGLMALWIMFGVDLYIVLANLQLVPFTGRNFYLLAAASDSDLLEGATLVLMAFIGLSLSGRTTT